MQQSVVVASGTVVSSPFGVRGLDDLTIFAPAVDSCFIYLQAGTTADSADFRRVRMTTSPASEWAWPVSSNAAAIGVGRDTVGRVPLIRLECSVVQTATRTFAIYTSRIR